MNDRPGWIQLLYKRHTAGHALHSAFLLDHFNRFIAEQANAQPDGCERLRRVALSELESQDPQFVALSLVCLGVVGRPEDSAIVERFVAHPSDLIQRAARTCQFELGHRGVKQENQ